MPTTRPMQPSDISTIAMVEELDVTADGTVAVVARRTIQRGSYLTHLYVVELESPGRRGRGAARPRRLTSGNVIDAWPRISPDGAQVAFISSPSDHVHVDAQPANMLCIVPIRGGKIRTIAPSTSAAGHGSIAELAWSPDGTRLAFTAEVDPPRWIVGTWPSVGSRAARRDDLAAPVARRITRADWRRDEVGHCDYWHHLFVVETTARSQPRQITSGDFGVSDVAWHPNATTVAFVADRTPDADTHPGPGIWAVDVDAGPRSKRARPRQLVHSPGGVEKPSFSPDGRWLCGVATANHDDEVSAGLILGPSDGNSPAWQLSADLDRPVGNWCETDLNGWMVDERVTPLWLDNETIIAPVTDRGRSLPMRWRIDQATGQARDVPNAADRSAEGPWADATTHAIVGAPGSINPAGHVFVLGTLAGRAMELLSVDLDHQQIRRRTSFGSSWQDSFVQPVMRRLDCPGPGGAIETWVASPPGSEGMALPTVVDIHGGPLGAWAPAPSIEVALLTGAGYRVLLPNIRGSASYGAAWVREQLGAWGGVDADDVHAVLDHATDLGMVEPARVGLLGLSYGGFLVNWLVGTSDRFAAAISENGVTNQVAAWANSDDGPAYNRSARLGDTLSAEGVDKLWQQSPLAHVATVNTPLLLLQGEADLRCPPHDNEQFFVALRHLGRPVEYVLYPEEAHVFAAAARPDRRIDRAERVLDWFATYL